MVDLTFSNKMIKTANPIILAFLTKYLNNPPHPNKTFSF